jgi:hypothetical protein
MRVDSQHIWERNRRGRRAVVATGDILLGSDRAITLREDLRMRLLSVSATIRLP